MFKFPALLFTLFICSIFNTFSQKNIDLVYKVVELYKSHRSISYDVAYKIKTFDDDTFLKMNGHCQVIRKMDDSIFNGLFTYTRVDATSNTEKIYDLNKLYVFNYNKKEFTSFDPAKNEIFPITGNIDGEFINTYFLKPDKLIQTMLDTTNRVTLQDTVMHKMKYLLVHINFPDDEDFHDCQKTILINKANYQIEYISRVTYLKDQIERKEWALKNIQFDKIKVTDIENRIHQIESKYSLIVFHRSNKPKEVIYDSTYTFPTFHGNILQTKSKYVSTSNPTKIKVYDFWYSSCFYCTKTVPFLNKLYHQYGDDIEVIGVNMIDTSDYKLKKCMQFITREKVDYPMLVSKDKSLHTLEISGYPTLFIIDKNGKLKHQTIGYSEKDDAEIEQIIKELIHH